MADGEINKLTRLFGCVPIANSPNAPFGLHHRAHSPCFHLFYGLASVLMLQSLIARIVMPFIRVIFIVFASISLSACVTWQQVPLTEHDHPTGFAKEIRHTAGQSFPYAQMAYNSYDRADAYDLGEGWTEAESGEDPKLDFQYKIYHRIADGEVKEIILAFRGTDSLKDFATGNLSLRQNRAGLALFDAQRAQWPGAKITVTGHSLGGGIASHITLNRENVDGFFFNTSPRFLKGKKSYPNARNSIAERGEINKLIRLFGREPTQLYTSINCSKGNPFKQHSAKALADCLTWMAAWDFPEAQASLIRNGIHKPVTRPAAPDKPDQLLD